MGAYVIRMITHTQNYTCAAILMSATLLSRYGKPEGCTSRNQTLLTDHTHTKPHTHTSSLEAVTPAYGVLCQVGQFFSIRNSEGVYLWPLKDDQVKIDVVRAKQKQRWGISRQLKLQVRGHIIQTLTQRGRKKKR